jgi:ribonucleotide reductase alpha subunit
MKRVLFFIEDNWAFGSIHNALCKELYKYDIYSNLLNWKTRYTKKEFDLLNKTYDFDKLGQITRILVRNLNIIIDINYYPVPEAENSNIKHRPLGIGVQGLGDLFNILNLLYSFCLL